MSLNPPHSVSFAGQDRLRACLPDIMAIATRHGLDLTPWHDIENTVRDFRVKLPVIGAFSAGKTSLINALLGKKQFSVEVTPETAVAAQLRFGPAFSAHLVSAEGQRLPVGEDGLLENTFPHWGPSSWLELTHPALMPWPHLMLIDLPGWGSGMQAHERVIDAHAAHSLAYVLVVSADEGSLRESLIRALTELAALKMPLILIINKIDKRTPEDVQAVRQSIIQAVERHSGAAPAITLCASARKGQVDALRSALTDMEKRADERFAAGVLAPTVEKLAALASHLERLSAQRFADQDVIEAEKEALEAEIAQWTQHLARETQKLHAQVGPIKGRLKDRLRNGLGEQVDHYLGLAENGSGLSDAILMDAREIIGRTLRDDFEPAVKRYLGSLDEALPSSLSLRPIQRGSVKLDESEGGIKPGAAIMASVIAVHAPKIMAALSALPVVGQIIAVAVPILGLFFKNRHERKQQALEEARARERQRVQIVALIEQASQTMVQHLGTQLDTRIAEVESTIAAHVDKEKTQRERVLRELEARLKEGEASAAKAREIAAHDLETVRGHQRDLAAFVGRG